MDSWTLAAAFYFRRTAENYAARLHADEANIQTRVRCDETAPDDRCWLVEVRPRIVAQPLLDARWLTEARRV